MMISGMGTCAGFGVAIDALLSGNWFVLVIGVAVIFAVGNVGNYAMSFLPDDEQPKRRRVPPLPYTYRRHIHGRSQHHIPTVYPENWSQVRQEVLARDEYKCGNCGSTKNLDVHHIVPLSCGGSNELGNLKTLCRHCHSLIHPHMRD
jgi:5-methylcytosine-specific restriction endonuclease McrA